jgi:hypothetical protein
MSFLKDGAIKSVGMHALVEDALTKMSAVCNYCNYQIKGGLYFNGMTKINPTELIRATPNIFLEKDIERKKRKLRILIREIFELTNQHGDNLTDPEIEKLIGRII